MVRAERFAVPFASHTLLSLLDRCLFPHFPYLSFVTRRQAGSLRRCRFIKQMRCQLAFSELLIIREEFRLIRITTNQHEQTLITERTTDATDITDWGADSLPAMCGPRRPALKASNLRNPIFSIETRSAPALTRCCPGSFTFYLGNPFPRFLFS